MHRLRRLALNNRALAATLFALAMAMKVLIPAGFMPIIEDGRIVISLCSGTGPMKMMMAMPGPDHGKSDENQHGKVEQPCAFAGLTAPSLAAADPILLVLAILFVMTLSQRPILPRVVQRPAHLRPPLRGPPILL